MKRPEATRDTMLREQLVAVIRCHDASRASDVAEAVISGGIHTLEITLTTPRATSLIENLAGRPGLTIGAGTVLAPHDLLVAEEAGASFVASPALDPSVVSLARERGLVAMPGALTPTEILHASRSGADFIKIFPMPHDAVAYLRSIRSVFPSIRPAPSGGVNDRTARVLIEAGATLLNVGSWLADNGDGTHPDVTEITRRARLLVDALAAPPEP